MCLLTWFVGVESDGGKPATEIIPCCLIIDVEHDLVHHVLQLFGEVGCHLVE